MADEEVVQDFWDVDHGIVVDLEEVAQALGRRLAFVWEGCPRGPRAVGDWHVARGWAWG